MLKTAAANMRSRLMSERKARAHGGARQGNAHFAAVMGGAIDSALSDSPDHCIADVINDDAITSRKNCRR